MKRLSGITRIEYLSVDTLPPDVTLKSLSGVPVGIFTALTSISHTFVTRTCRGE